MALFARVGNSVLTFSQKSARDISRESFFKVPYAFASVTSPYSGDDY